MNFLTFLQIVNLLSLPVPSSPLSGGRPPASIAGHCDAAWTLCCQEALALTGHGTRSKDGTGHDEMAQATMIETLKSTNSTFVQNQRPADTKMYTH